MKGRKKGNGETHHIRQENPIGYTKVFEKKKKIKNVNIKKHNEA
jgi:hypothetical protein